MPYLYLIAVAWIFVVLLIALAEATFIAGFMTLAFYCIIPLFLTFYILLSPSRKRKNKKTKSEEIH